MLDPPPDTDEVVLLSIGTGTSLMRIAGHGLDWGQAQWARPLIQIVLDGVTGVADYQCRQFLGKRYCRLAPIFAPDDVIALDDAHRIADLVRFAEEVEISGVVEWLEAWW